MASKETWYKCAGEAWNELASMEKNKGKPKWEELTPAQQEMFVRDYEDAVIKNAMGKNNKNKER